MNLQRKVGPLPLWAWIALGGGTLGVIVLVKKSKGSKASTESEPIPSSLASPFGPEAAGVGGGGSGGLTAPPEAKTPEPLTLTATAPIERTPVSEFLQTLAELEGGGFTRAGAAPTGSSAPATSAALSAARGGNPRAGKPFKVSTYKGMRAHEYRSAVPGGVGPGHRFVILPVGKKNHAAKPNHAPAHAKDRHHAHAHAPVHPTVHTHKPARHAPAKRGRRR
jgi:hypothetical protein